MPTDHPAARTFPLICACSGRALLGEDGMVLAEDEVQKHSAPGQACHRAQVKGPPELPEAGRAHACTVCTATAGVLCLHQALQKDTVCILALPPLGTAFLPCLTNRRVVSDWALVCVGISACLTLPRIKATTKQPGAISQSPEPCVV